MKRNEVVALAMEYASYLVCNAERIENIILFGSVARGDFDKKSDIDVFVDIRNPSKKDEKSIKKITDNFYDTKCFEKWKLLGIEKDFSVIVGDANKSEWAGLKRSIMTDGITLYGKYLSAPKKMLHYILISYKPVKNDKKRVNLHRRLFGYILKGKRYHGIVETEGGIRVSSNSFLIKIGSYRKVKNIFSELSIDPSVIEVWID